MEITVDKVIDKGRIAQNIHSLIEAGIDLLNKPVLSQDDMRKFKAMNTIYAGVKEAVKLVQQENVQVRAKLVQERMKNLGYFTNDEPNQIA